MKIKTDKIHRPKHKWLVSAVNIVIWVIAGVIALVSIVFGVGIAVSMISAHPQDGIVGVIVGLGFILLGSFIAFTIIAFYKMISFMLDSYSLVRDYKRRKKRGDLLREHYREQ